MSNLIKYINNPYNDLNNFNLACEYHNSGHTAAALSFYLRCAEYTIDEDIAYECLIKMSICLDNQKNRDNMSLECLKHAFSVKPKDLNVIFLSDIIVSAMIG